MWRKQPVRIDQIGYRIVNISSQLQYALDYAERRKQKAFGLLSKLSDFLKSLTSINYKFNSEFHEGIDLIAESNSSNVDTLISNGRRGLVKIINGLKAGKEDCHKDMVTNGILAATNVAVAFISPIALLNLAIGGGNVGVAVTMKKTKEKLEEAIIQAERLLSELNSY